MKKIYFAAIIIAVFIALLTGGIIFWKKAQNNKKNNQTSTSPSKTDQLGADNNQSSTTSSTSSKSSTSSTSSLSSPNPNLDYPIAGFTSRITKKPFGIYITPQTSPVQPERFTGYHTGTDIEYGDITSDVPVYAISDATVRYIGTVSGYGGVIILEAPINGQDDTLLYGHIRLSSATVKVGEAVSKGQKIAVLGTAYSAETDGERRHLHFAIHKGTSIVFLGYVQQKSQLSDWIDPQTIY